MQVAQLVRKALSLAAPSELLAAAQGPIPRDARPNILIVGVGHSGTSVLTKMLGCLGWHTPAADEEFAECVPLRDANDQALIHGALPAAAEAIVAELDRHSPWVAKDPRLCLTLPLWWPLFRDNPPLVLHLEKQREQVEASFHRRGTQKHGEASIRYVQGSPRYKLDELYASLEDSLRAWPYPVVTVHYDQIAAASQLFQAR
jgi:hypothetical protein